jgi:exosortase
MKQTTSKPITLQSLALPLLLAVAFALITFPSWRWLWGEWMGNDYYSHGILILPLCLFLGYQRIRRDDTFAWRPGQGSLGGLLLFAASLVAYLWFVNQRAWYLASFAMIAMIAGGVWLLGGVRALRTLAFPIGYLVFMVPLPLIERSTLPLALFTGVCSGALVQFLGLDVTIVGNSVTLPNADLVIGAQCSGVNSLITLFALMTLLAYLVEGPLWARLLLVLLAIPLALLGNILRVASLLFVARAWGADAAFTFYHDYSGFLFFIGILLLIYPLTRLLGMRTLRSNVI